MNDNGHNVSEVFVAPSQVRNGKFAAPSQVDELIKRENQVMTETNPPEWIRGREWRFEAVWEVAKHLLFKMPDANREGGDLSETWSFDDGIITHNGIDISSTVVQEEHSEVTRFVSLRNDKKRDEGRKSYSILCEEGDVDHSRHVLYEWREWNGRLQYRKMLLDKSFTLGKDGIPNVWNLQDKETKSMEIPYQVVE